MLVGLIVPRLRLGFVSALPQLRLDYALASISCEHCRSSRNNPHYAPRYIIYYKKGISQNSFFTFLLLKVIIFLSQISRKHTRIKILYRWKYLKLRIVKNKKKNLPALRAHPRRAQLVSLASLSVPRARDLIVALRARTCALRIHLSLFLII